ncbi:MAG: amidase [Acidimicrobiaceae bacterium]|nr:amidase [Acidimicrobiaceae bacterium]
MSYNSSSDALGLRSATDLLEMLAARSVSSAELLDHFIERNTLLGDEINAIVTLDLDRASELAKASDQRRAGNQVDGILDGLPMTIKDAIAVEGIRSTGGAVELAEHVPSKDAEAVTKIKAAGGIVFGKTNLPRWSGDIQAFNDIFGTTNNPWNLKCGPGGSSGGASAAVAAGLTPWEVGTDIGGSVRLPAHFAGVCGHKPSFGVVPQLGYIDHVSYGVSDADINVFGPIAKTVDDLELLFDVVSGTRSDLQSSWRLDLPSTRGSARDLRVASWLDDADCPVSEAVANVLETAISAIEADGVTVNRSARPDVLFSDVRSVGLPLISAATSPGRTEEELAALRQVIGDPSADESIRMRAASSTMSHRDWLLLTEKRDRNRRLWSKFFEGIDVLLAPVAFVSAFEHQQEGTLYTRSLKVDGQTRPYSDLIIWTSQFGYVYLPSTVVPVGWTNEGLPVGIQVVGPYLGDRTTLVFARYLEKLLGGYQIPPIADI